MLVIIIRQKNRSGDNKIATASVQQAMLKILEGAQISVTKSNHTDVGGFTFDTRRLTIILSGAFEGIMDIVQKRCNPSKFGFEADNYSKEHLEIEEEDFDIDMNDLEIETMRSSGAGGQHINKTDSAVRIVHKPTGIVVKCQDGRSQHENRATALMTIRARVYEERQREIDEKAGAERRTKIGTGDRAEKIRTYNYPQNRVTDHRIGYTVNQLDRIMDGRLEDLMNALQLADQQAKLAGENQ